MRRFRFPRGQAVPPWSPLDVWAAARVFDSREGVTSSSSATRHRTGVISSDVLGGEVLDPVDGAGMILLNSGRILHIGGAPLGDGETSVNTIRASDDEGETFAVLLAHEAGPTYTRFRPGHSLGVCQDSTYGYVFGGDPIIGGNGEVWRTPLSGDGTSWTLVATHAWLASRVGFWWGVLNDEIIIGGGQTDIFTASTSLTSYYKLTGGGVTSTSLGNAPFAARGFISGACPVMNIGGTDELLLVGGGRYDSNPANDVFYDDVWSFDGTTWTERLATGHGQFAGTRYNTVIVHNDRAWLFTGSISGDADTAAVYTATAPGTWTASTMLFAHGDSHARAAISTPDGILYDNGFQPGTPPQTLYVIREHTGALVSSWEDQGSAGIDTTQATDANKPILDPQGFSTRPGLVFTLAQMLKTAAPDRDIANGVLEIAFVARTLNPDTSSAQGPNPPCVVVGSANGSTWNNSGFSGDEAMHKHQQAGQQTVTTTDAGINDDHAHRIHIVQTSADTKIYVDGALAVTGAGGFSTSWTGWDTIGAGYLDADKGAFVLGAMLILQTESAAMNDESRGLVDEWLQGWAA
jgi:hypothetical protein